MIKQLKILSVPEQSGKRIGLFRTILSIFGGLLVAYLSMTTLIFLIPGSAGESIVVPLLLNTLVWAFTALWISLAYSKLSAILRVVVPTFIFSILLAILYNI